MRTNFGPEESVEEQEEDRKRVEQEKEDMKTALIEQMKTKFATEKEAREKERELDLENLITATEVLTAERQRELDKSRESK